MATFILLHGSWHGAWCWHKVVRRLTAGGHRALALDLPAHGRAWRLLPGLVTLGEMARTVCRAIDAVEGPVTLVAHSRGGIVASQVAERMPDRVGRLVYVAAFMLRDGERVLEYFRDDRDSLVRRNVRVDRLRMTDRLLPEAYREALYADCSEDDVALASSLLIPEPGLPALTRLSLSAERYGRVPRYYVELTEDRAVSPALQRRLYGAQPCERVIQLAASHSAYFSRPGELTDVLQTIAGTG